MSGKQLSLDSRMDLVQRLVTDKSQGDQIDESSEAIDASSDNEEAEGMYSSFSSSDSLDIILL